MRLTHAYAPPNSTAQFRIDNTELAVEKINPAPQSVDVDVERPAAAIGRVSGWRMEHYGLIAQCCVVPDDVEASNLYQAAQAIAAGRVPSFVAPYFAGGRLLGLTKPNGPVLKLFL